MLSRLIDIIQSSMIEFKFDKTQIKIKYILHWLLNKKIKDHPSTTCP
jgi:hypothetical protein